MKDIRLYIANKLVDCSDELSLPMTYVLEDFNNPTLVKNSFSKTIAIPGTKNNNKIFGEIYKLDRMQHYEEWTGNPELNGIDFDPSKRVDFQIFKDADLVESGYMQLNDISIQDNNITYNITLYGGIGDFFYGLKYNEDGTTKTLADLQYFIEDENGNVLDPATELDFEVNKEFVSTSFSKDFSTEGNTIYDTIAFIPAYNGVYEDFDSSKCLVNTNQLSTSVIPSSVTVDGKTYSPAGGYGLANLEKDYTEWEMRDLRSKYQRPAIKLSKLIKTICREENSGYNVTFDDTFFNKDNPYWSKTFVALPLLTSNDYVENTDVPGSSNISQLETADNYIATKNGVNRSGYRSPLIVADENITVGSDGVMTVNNWTNQTVMSLSVGFRFWVHTPTDPKLYPQWFNALWPTTTGVGGKKMYYNEHYSVYLAIENADTNQIVGFSTVSQLEFGKNIGVIKPFPTATVEQKTGYFLKSQAKTFYFAEIENNNNSEFKLSVRNCKLPERFRVYLCTNATIDTNYSTWASEYHLSAAPMGTETLKMTPYWGESLISSGSATLSTVGNAEADATFSKNTVLKTEQTPADFLIDYAKLFGLYFIKNRYEKSIYICTRNTFFNGEVNDWRDRIDYQKDMTVTPILFDKKYYLMQLDTPETKDALRYKSQYSQQYGQQRLGTGYNFNYDTYNLYEDNIYQQIVPVIDSDRLFRNFYDSNGNLVPSWLVDNASYELFSGDESTTVDLYGRNLINSGRTVEWNQNGSDVWAKPAFFSIEGDTKSLVEIESCLLMWNGVKPTVDSTGNNINFWITDKIAAMDDLNDGESCFIYTESEYDVNNNRIAIKMNSLPQYLNCIIDSSNNVNYSLDFGLPKEVYMGYVNYDENATLYSNFWKSFYNDQFNIDTKKVTCFVRLYDMNQDFLREFYFFDNAIWILNKVDSYDINSDATVRVEFVKVQDVNDYTNGVTTF